MQASFAWTVPPSVIAAMVDNVRQRAPRLILDRALTPMAQQMEREAKLTAPWQDRTGDARKTLAFRASYTGGVFRVLGWHGVYYGIFLETMQGGAYAIVLPVQQKYEPRLKQIVEGVFMGMF